MPNNLQMLTDTLAEMYSKDFKEITAQPYTNFLQFR